MKKINIKKKLPKLLGAAGGGVASLFVEKFIPIEKPDLKSAISIGIGCVLGAMDGMAGDVGAGIVAGSSRGFAAKKLPQLGITGPFIEAPDDDQDYPVMIQAPEDQSDFIYSETIQGVQPEYPN